MRFKLLLLYLFLFQINLIAQTNKIDITGQVIDSKTKKGISFVSLYVEELNGNILCDIDGKFKLYIKYVKKANLSLSSLGYASKDTLIDNRNSNLKINLDTQSIALNTVTINAKYKKKGSEAVIDEKSLELIQPTSIKDIFVLLPGGRVSDNNIQYRSLINSRQIGSDQTTSFGMGITMDGIPLTDDGKRVQMSVYTGKVAIDYDNNLAMNSGIDLRTLSTDHIQKITIARGISSAKEGNLSSGLIKITSKHGKSPLKLRVKSDPLNSLLYLGKGFKLSDKLGTLHAGLDVTKSANDIRDSRFKYNRITSQINYNNQFKIYSKKINFNLRTSYIKSFNDKKTDDLIKLNKESYENKYNNISFSSRINAVLDNLFMSKLEMMTSYNYSKDLLNHTKKVNVQESRYTQTSFTKGENIAKYLPETYYSEYSIDNRPVNLFGSLTATKTGRFDEKFNYKILYGNSFSYTKNIGDGVVLKSKLPPFPSNRFLRPRNNRSIPALVNNSSFVETNLGFKTEKHKLDLSLGLRGTKMLNLPKLYTLSKIYLLEPRIQSSYTFTNKSLSNTIWVGYGTENKLPSLDYLYPDDEYQDFVMLKHYSIDYLITNTVVNKITNAKIRENKNKKVEIGFDTNYKKFVLSLSVFREIMQGGVQYTTHYHPVSYMTYTAPPNFSGKVSKEAFNPSLKKEFSRYKKPKNSAEIIKKGIEYRVNIPKIKSISSSIQLNGAYYYSVYSNALPFMYRPSVMQEGKSYPYVGFYNGFKKRYGQIVNTSLWVNTHIPKYKLIFTNFLRVNWMQTMQLGQDSSVNPLKYMDLDGNVTDFEYKQILNNKKLLTLVRRFPKEVYNVEERGLMLSMNFKLTKEFNKYVKLSFFANNFIQYNSEFSTKYGKTLRGWKSPFFGSELIINL